MNDKNEERLRWRCRRGMQELDILLARYLCYRYPRADTYEQQIFAELLALEDDVLFACLLQGLQPPDPKFVNLLAQIHTCSHVCSDPFPAA